MQDAGIRAIFGVEGLKIHSKLVHIGTRHGEVVRYFSTGNFHEGNARMLYRLYHYDPSSPSHCPGSKMQYSTLSGEAIHSRQFQRVARFSQ